MGNNPNSRPFLRTKTRAATLSSGTSYYQHFFVEGADFAVVDSTPILGRENLNGEVKVYKGGDLTQFIKTTQPFKCLEDAASTLDKTKYAIVFIRGIVIVDSAPKFKNTVIASYYDFVEAPSNTKLSSNIGDKQVRASAFANINFDHVAPVLEGKLICLLGVNITGLPITANLDNSVMVVNLLSGSADMIINNKDRSSIAVSSVVAETSFKIKGTGDLAVEVYGSQLKNERVVDLFQSTGVGIDANIIGSDLVRFRQNDNKGIKYNLLNCYLQGCDRSLLTNAHKYTCSNDIGEALNNSCWTSAGVKVSTNYTISSTDAVVYAVNECEITLTLPMDPPPLMNLIISKGLRRDNVIINNSDGSRFLRIPRNISSVTLKLFNGNEWCTIQNSQHF